MTVRLMTDPRHEVKTRNDQVVVRLNVLGSRLGPVEIEIDTGTALALVEEIKHAVSKLACGALCEDDICPTCETSQVVFCECGQGYPGAHLICLGCGEDPEACDCAPGRA